MAVSQSPSLSTVATDPLRNFKFIVEILPNGSGGPIVTMGFMTVSGIATNIDVIPYREGGMNTTTQKMPGQADFNPVTFAHGIIVGTQYDLTWIQQLFTVMQGSGTQKPGDDFRHNVQVGVLDHPVNNGPVNVKAGFQLYRCWPTSMAYSDLDAGANQLLIAQMALAYEGYDLEIATGSGASDAASFNNGASEPSN